MKIDRTKILFYQRLTIYRLFCSVTVLLDSLKSVSIETTDMSAEKIKVKSILRKQMI